MLRALPRSNYVNEAEEKYGDPISVGGMAEKCLKGSGMRLGVKEFDHMTSGFRAQRGLHGRRPAKLEELHPEVRVRVPGNT